MTDTDDPKSVLHHYLRSARSALLWKLDGLSDYDVRRPMTATGTNLLGLVKHLAYVEAGYFGEVFDRPFPEALPAWSDDAEPNADMWATPAESRQDVVDLYGRACAHADVTIEALRLDSVGHVGWWPGGGAVDLHTVLVHVVAETDRHAGHADIVRELLDRSAGLRAANTNLPELDEAGWSAYYEQVERAARTFLPD